MFSSTLFWCLSSLCVLGLESAIVWQDIPENEGPCITTCIINSNQFEATSTTPVPIPNKQTTQARPPKIIPVCQFIIEDDPDCRLVVSSYDANGQTSHFFAALDLGGKSARVTRLGSMWNTVNQNRVPMKKIVAKSQAEHYYLWTPYPFKENWQQVAENDSCQQKIKDKNYTLKWIWPVVNDYMVGIYCGPSQGSEQFRSYIFSIGQQLNTANAKLVTISEPTSLDEAEAIIDETLSDAHPFLAKQWLTADQLKAELGQDSTALNSLTELAAFESKVVSRTMVLLGAKIVPTCEGIICIFHVQTSTVQQSYYVLAGGQIKKGGDYRNFEMTMYFNLGNDKPTIKKCDILVKNHYTLAFSPSILSSSSCQWPWKHATSPIERHPFPYETMKESIAEKAPFTVIWKETFVQKIITHNYAASYSASSFYRTAGFVIYSYKSRFFVAAIIESCGEYGIVHVSGLMFAEHLSTEIDRCDKQHFAGPLIPISFEKAIPKIQSALPNITGWKESQIPMVSQEWVVEKNRVVAPVTPRNASTPTDWCYFIFKITIEDMDTISYKFFVIVVVNQGDDIIVVEFERKKTWFSKEEAKAKFQEFLKKQYAKVDLQQ